MRRTIGVAVVALALGGCAGGTEPSPTVGTEPASTSSATPAPTSGGEPPVTSAPELITVPDVSGMNHQDAQDTMQAAGLYNLREVDGTGRGRMLILDRDWVQTGQTPAAGTKVTPDTVITLTAIKYSDR
ncbi:PASTA domain-containing protein [Amycolatopsis sacchari]|uniref:PASTA domain-containing protein n=1 Tax=Amycolatopsis sacchari TaxID=115433 RepID=UPI003D72DA90